MVKAVGAIGPSAIGEWRNDPIKFVRDMFQVKPDAWQEKVLLAFANADDEQKRRISMQACVGPGKSAVLAWCIWNFQLCYAEKGEHPKGAAVSITGDNLKDNLWAELAKWRQRSPLLLKMFEWTAEKIFNRQHPETWFFSARSWSKAANPEDQGKTLSGLHAKFVLVVVDESGEIPVSIMNAGEQALGNCAWGKMLQAGNPSSLDGMLYAAATTFSKDWFVVRITSDPDDPDRTPRVDKEWARQQINTYGRNNPWVMSSILGQFPPTALNTLLGPDEVRTAMSRHLKKDQYEFSQKRLGIDAARFGDDKWVIFPRQGLAAFWPSDMRNPRSHDVSAKILESTVKWGSEVEFFDGTGGYAAGAIDACIMAGRSPIEVSFSGKADDPRFFNKRAEMWWRMAEWIKRGGALPNIPDLVAELTVPTYYYQNGKFRLEDKEQIKLRLKRSPNYADALALTFAWQELPSSTYPGLNGLPFKGGAGKLLYDEDPLSEKAFQT